MPPGSSRTLRRGLSALACAVLLAGLVGALPAASQTTRSHSAPALHRAAAPDFAALVASRTATVVDIHTLRAWRDPLDASSSDSNEAEFTPDGEFADRLAWPMPTAAPLGGQVRDLASGLIVASDGLIMTSAHVVAHADEAQVRLADGRRFAARLVGSDARSDIALLKIDAQALPVATIGNSSRLRPGDWVASIGAPFGFRGSVTSGVVSARNRFIAGAGDVPYIQTDVAINPGSSGSPLFNSRGEVVGLNSMIYTGSGGYMGVSFAVPIDLAMQSMAQLLSGGQVHRVRLGAQLQDMTPPLAQSFGLPQATGVLVAKIEAGGAAEQAGLAMGDVLTSFDGRAVAGLPELLRQVADRMPGTSSRLGYWRQGAMHSALVVWREEPAAGGRTLQPRAPARVHDGLGLRLAELPPARREQLQVDGGLLVLESEGAARAEGIRAGDVVVAINDRPVARVEDFRSALAEVPPSRPAALLVMRERRLTYVPVATSAPQPMRRP